MYYKTRDGITYDLAVFSPEEQKCLEWLKQEFAVARSWTSFQERTASGIINLAKKAYGGNWDNHPLYHIQQDMVANVGIRQKELQGDISDMFID